MGADNMATGTIEADRAIYLKMYAGEVITSFEKHTVMLDKHNVRTIKSGKSAQLPVIGRLPDAEYHTPGTELLGQQVPHSEVVIPVDKLLLSHVFIDDLDDAIRHFEVRGKYSAMQGQKLSQTFDKHAMLNGIIGAKADANITGEDGGFAPAGDDNLKNADDDLFLEAWVKLFRAFSVNFDNKFVTGKRWAIVKPDVYRRLATIVNAAGFSLMNRDHGVTKGDFSEASLPPIAGIELVSSPMLPQADLTALEFHGVDASKVQTLAFTEGLIGTVKLMDISLQSQWDIRRQGTLMVARYAMGHGVLQPECGAVGESAT
jgi:hypothetical protein